MRLRRNCFFGVHRIEMLLVYKEIRIPHVELHFLLSVACVREPTACVP